MKSCSDPSVSERLGKINKRAASGTVAPDPGFKLDTASLAGFRETINSRVDRQTIYEPMAEASMARNLVTADSSVFQDHQ